MEMFNRHSHMPLFALLAATLAVGCDDPTPSPDCCEDSENDTGAKTPIFGVISIPTVSGDAPTTSYFILADNLNGAFNSEDAVLEIEGRATAGAPNGGKHVFIGTGDSGEVTRYDLDGDTLVEAGKVNFAAQEVTEIEGYSTQFQFISDTKAYWFSREGRIVIWNPEELTAPDSIEVADMIREDPDNPGTNYTTSLTGAPLNIGDKIYSFVSWDSRAAGAIRIPGAYGVLVVDTVEDTAELFVDESGCGYGRDGVLDGEWLYIATEAVGTSVHRLSKENGPAPCLRRFNIDTQEFDDDYNIDLNALAGAPTGSLAITADGEALIHVLDSETADPLIEDGTINHPRVLASGDLWKTAKLTVGDAPEIEVLDVPLRSASVLPVTLRDDLRVTPKFGEAYKIVEITEDGFEETSETGAIVDGLPWALVQIR